MAEFRPFNPNEFLNNQVPPPPTGQGQEPQAATQGYQGQKAYVPPQEARGPAPHQGNQSPSYGAPSAPQGYNQGGNGNNQQPTQGFQGNQTYQGGTYNAGGAPQRQWNNGPKKEQTYHVKLFLTWSPKYNKEGWSMKITDLGRQFLRDNINLIDGLRFNMFEDALAVIRQQGLYGKRMAGMGWWRLQSTPDNGNGQQGNYQNSNNQGNYSGGYNGQ